MRLDHNFPAVRATHGTIDLSATVGGFALVVATHARNMRLPRHSHAEPKIAFVLRGGFRESFRGRDFVCDTGALLCKPAGEPHTNRYGSDGAQTLLIDANAATEERQRMAAWLYNGMYFSPGGPPNRLAFRIAGELQNPDECSGLAIEGLILELLAAGVRQKRACLMSGDELWLRRAIEYLHANRTARVSLTTLAQVAEVRPVRLARAFRRRYGQTPGAFQRRLRVEWAAEELVRTDRPIAEIGVEAGFTDQSHFTRVFGRVLGETPGSYRNRTTAH